MSLPTRTCAARVLCKMTGLDADARYNIFFTSLGHLHSRSVDLIVVLNNKSDELVKDLSLNLEVLKLTWEHDFSR